jgi:hypothetical protein
VIFCFTELTDVWSSGVSSFVLVTVHYVGWSGEVWSITFSGDSRTVSVVYRVTVQHSDGEVGEFFLLLNVYCGIFYLLHYETCCDRCDGCLLESVEEI